jgi:hypothetical protein
VEALAGTVTSEGQTAAAETAEAGEEE